MEVATLKETIKNLSNKNVQQYAKVARFIGKRSVTKLHLLIDIVVNTYIFVKCEHACIVEERRVCVNN